MASSPGSAEFAIMLFQIFVTVARLLKATIAWYIDVGLVLVCLIGCWRSRSALSASTGTAQTVTLDPRDIGPNQ
jgi:hypothetical protein